MRISDWSSDVCPSDLEKGNGWLAHPMKKLARAAELLMGVVDQGEDGKLWLRAVDKKVRRDTPISDIGQAKPGALVLAEPAGRLPRISADRKSTRRNSNH